MRQFNFGTAFAALCVLANKAAALLPGDFEHRARYNGTNTYAAEVTAYATVGFFVGVPLVAATAYCAYQFFQNKCCPRDTDAVQAAQQELLEVRTAEV